MGNVIVILTIAAMVTLAVRSIIKNKKAGKTCGCGCENCSKNCKQI